MEISQETLKIHQESIIIDAHCDSMGREFEGQRRLKEQSDLGQWDFPRAIQGGLTTEFLATFVNPERGGGEPGRRCSSSMFSTRELKKTGILSCRFSMQMISRKPNRRVNSA